MDAVTDPLEQYVSLYQRLSKRARWDMSAAQQRIVSMILATVPIDDPLGTLEEAASELRRRAGWFGPLSSPIRYSVAAMLIRRKLPPGQVHDRVLSILPNLKGRRLPWGGHGRTLAGVLLSLRSFEDKSRSTSTVVFDRMERIYRLWKEDHPAITGDDDLPMLALHALRDEPPGALSERLEKIYRELNAGGVPKGNALQLSSQILGVLPWGAGEAAGRFQALRDSFLRHGEKISRSRLDEVALLSLAPGAPDDIVDQVVTDQRKLRERKPRVSKAVAFNLAAGLVLTRCDAATPEQARKADLPEISALGQVRAVLEAQQAAMAAVVASSAASH